MPNKKLTVFQKSIEGYLLEEGFSRVEPALAGQLLMRGKIVTKNKEFDTLIEVPSDVPASHPKFYTINNDMVFYHPHIERPKKEDIGTLTGMCFQKENEKLYCNNSQELIHHAYNKYEKLCIDLSDDVFDKKRDFLEEFDSYWPRSINLDIFMHIDTKPKDRSMLSLVILKSDDEQQQAILYDDIHVIDKYVEFSKYDVVNKLICPYIDIGSHFSLPFPSTYKDLMRLFYKSGHVKFLKKLQSNQNIWSVLIIGLDLPNGEKHYAAVSLLDIKDEKLIEKKSKYQVFFTKRYENIHFKGINIKSILRKWLMQRGGNDSTRHIAENNFTVAILGCGSVGSNLAYKLCKSGISNIILVDPHELKSSNIGRHFLGISEVGKKKVVAMQTVLQSQFIDMDVKAIDKSAQQCIDEFSSADLIIGTIGSDEPSVEPYLAELTIRDELSPMFICWLEANAVAGHGFYVDQKIVSNSYEQKTEDMSILIQDFASGLIQNEVGCNSDYMPYSHLSADEHINKMAQFVVDIALDKRLSRAISSYGNVTQYKNELLYQAQSNSVKYWNDDDFEI
ncbi:ThiF family adenylyltransferase [Sulfurimonas sp.]|uniref:ThiF family adenylyltransferase n=1 Tax=Sulfurimonas sp. TaxID=2022749 RepID=UPI0026145FFB|nr:ThiF family adenylyltransferase [Sulfurimonas sp.]MDD5156829.1 ThiF family adenylyltransferase [Sulfurimonas sp.]